MRSLWHTMTTNDRHASYQSDYSTARHAPLRGSRHTPLTSVVTDDLDADDKEYGSSNGRSSPRVRQMRGMQTPLSAQDTSYSANGMASADGTDAVPMQSFEQGVPPPPPVTHSWKRMDRWLEDNYEELYENLCEGCTQNDMNELEAELECALPQDVRDSWQFHDGQERGGRPTGVIFGCMLLDCEEIVQEWNQWRRTDAEFLNQSSTVPYSGTEPSPLPKAFASGSAASSSSSSTAAQPPTNGASGGWREKLAARQSSQPPNACQKAYIHPAWIPLARDWGGNNICIDLAPGSAGTYGQVILMGRDYDCKYVIARSWAAFLATVADDMATDKWYIDEETAELKLREFPKQPNIAPAYMDILRWRADQLYGPRFRPGPQHAPRKRQPLKVDSGVKDQYASLNGFSPYASSSTGRENHERVLSPPRGHGKSAAKAPPHSSPLARVTEESGANTPRIATKTSDNTENLVTIDSPIIGSSKDGDDDSAKHFIDEKAALAHAAENKKPDAAGDDGMKAVPL